MKQVKSNNVRVVSEALLDDIGQDNFNLGQLFINHKISSWGSDVSIILQCFVIGSSVCLCVHFTFTACQFC